MIKCKVCGMEFTEQIRLDRHCKTHQNKKSVKSKSRMPDFDKPDFSQVMWNPSQKIFQMSLRETEQCEQ